MTDKINAIQAEILRATGKEITAAQAAKLADALRQAITQHSTVGKA